MDNYKFEEYIEFLRSNIGPLIEYQGYVGTVSPGLLKIKRDLFNKDPFVVIDASIEATKAFADEKIYH